MATVTFKQVKQPNTKQLEVTLLEGGKQVLNAEMKRIAKDRYRPIVRRWTGRSKKNNTVGTRPSFRTQTRLRKSAKMVNAHITVTDAEDGKPLFKWVHQTGTRPHIIAPTKPHGLLVWEGARGTVFHRGPVNHPGFASSGEDARIKREEPPKIADRLEAFIGGKFVTITR